MWSKFQVQLILKAARVFNTARKRVVGVGGSVIDPPDCLETYLLFKWLWLSGRPVEQVLRVRSGDVDFEGFKVTYRLGRRNVRVSLPPYFLFEIKRFLEKKSGKDGRIFSLSVRTFEKRVKDCLKRVNIVSEGGVKLGGLHYFRRSFLQYAVEFVNKRGKRFGVSQRVRDYTLLDGYLSDESIEALYSGLL